MPATAFPPDTPNDVRKLIKRIERLERRLPSPAPGQLDGVPVIVAAYNAPQWWIDRAHFVCVGSADDTKINEALALGYWVLLSPGDFYVQTSDGTVAEPTRVGVDVDDDRRLDGCGMHQTTIHAEAALTASTDCVVRSRVGTVRFLSIEGHPSSTGGAVLVVGQNGSAAAVAGTGDVNIEGVRAMADGETYSGWCGTTAGGGAHLNVGVHVDDCVFEGADCYLYTVGELNIRASEFRAKPASSDSAGLTGITAGSVLEVIVAGCRFDSDSPGINLTGLGNGPLRLTDNIIEGGDIVAATQLSTGSGSISIIGNHVAGGIRAGTIGPAFGEVIIANNLVNGTYTLPDRAVEVGIAVVIKGSGDQGVNTTVATNRVLLRTGSPNAAVWIGRDAGADGDQSNNLVIGNTFDGTPSQAWVRFDGFTTGGYSCDDNRVVANVALTNTGTLPTNGIYCATNGSTTAGHENYEFANFLPSSGEYLVPNGTSWLRTPSDFTIGTAEVVDLPVTAQYVGGFGVETTRPKGVNYDAVLAAQFMLGGFG